LKRESHRSAYLAILDLYCCFVFEVHVLIINTINVKMFQLTHQALILYKRSMTFINATPAKVYSLFLLHDRVARLIIKRL